MVDHLQHAARIAKGNDYADVSNALAPFQRIAAETGCCILVLHHQRKPQATDVATSPDSPPDEIEALGSDAYRAASETIFECSKWRDCYHVRSQSRGLDDLPRSRVVIDFETGNVTIGDAWEEKLDSAGSAIAVYLTKQPGQTEKEIRHAVRGHNARAMTEALRDESRFRREGVGGHKDPFRYFVVPEPLYIQSEQRLKNTTQPPESKGESLVLNKTPNSQPKSPNLCFTLFRDPGTDKTPVNSTTYPPNSHPCSDIRNDPQITLHGNHQNRPEPAEQPEQEEGSDDETEVKV